MSILEKVKDSVEIFISYVQEDEALFLALENHLSSLKHSSLIRAWNNNKIEAGTDWIAETSQHLKSADIILLLVSAEFLGSEQIYKSELDQAIQRHSKREARVIPVLLRPVDWVDTPFSQLQPLPLNRKPITSWVNQDEAFLDVSKGVRSVVASLRKQRYAERFAQYKLIFQEIISQHYPIPEGKENFLKAKHHEMCLKTEDVMSFEKPIREEKKAEYQKHQEKIQQYKKTYLELLELEYPLTENGKSLLLAQQQKLCLKQEDIERVERPIRASKQAEYNQKLQQYKDLFKKEISFQYSLNREQRERLNRLKEELKLADIDVKTIESEVLTPLKFFAQKFLTDIRQYFAHTVPSAANSHSFRNQRGFWIGVVACAGISIFAVSQLTGESSEGKNSYSPVSPPPSLTPNQIAPPKDSTQRLSVEDATQFIYEWLQVKPQVFGPSYNWEAAAKYTDGNKYASIIKGVNELKKKGVYYSFTGTPEVVYEGHYCSYKNKVEIHLRTIQFYSEYKGLEHQKDYPSLEQMAFGFQFVDGEWQYVDDGKSTEIEPLQQFRQRFWGEDLSAFDAGNCTNY